MKKTILITLLICSIQHLCFSQSKETKETPLKTTHNTTLSELEFTDIKGNTYTNDKLKDNLAVFTFWHIDNTSCTTEIPKLNQLQMKFQNRDVLFFAVALDNTSQLESFLETTDFNFTIVPNGTDLANKFGVPQYPYHIVIDKSGHIEHITQDIRLNTIHHLQRRIHRLLR